MGPINSSIIRNSIALRNSAKENLPINDSFVAYDLILFIAIQFEENQHISVKHLFSSFPHSYSAVREHYKRLIHDGYLVHKLDEKDRRIKYIEPTEKFICAVLNYTKYVQVI